MEGAMVSAATGVMSAVVAKLTALLGEEYKLVKGIRKDMEFLKQELCVMKDLLQVLADVEEPDAFNKSWRDRVRDLAYDIEDCIDLNMHRVNRRSDGAKGGFGGKLLGKLKDLMGASHQIVLEIKELKARVAEESERHRRYTPEFLPSNSSSCAKVDPRMHALWAETKMLVGIDGPRDEIISLLMGGESTSCKTLSIVGCAGLGKTTLAKQAYDKIKGDFDCTAFVSVSQKPAIGNVLKDICSQVGATAASDDLRNLIDTLRDYLRRKRYFVVVDDIWESSPWDFIRLALVESSPGSIIIITTRMEDLAKSCCCSQGDRVYKMKQLDRTESKRLFFKRIFGYEEMCPPQLVQASEEILNKCDDIPLAIISISSFLAGIPQSAYHWNKVKQSISSPLGGNKYGGTMESVLALSYFNLPQHLRTCLLYLSTFPEDFLIRKDRLISRWIAEGFISAQEQESLYEAGVRHFNMLINRSLIQPWDEINGEVMTCRVHDVILNFVVSKSVEENFVTLFGPSGLPTSLDSRVRRFSLQDSQENLFSWLKLARPHVRSLSTFVDCKDLHPLSYFRVLRVLDLEGCESLQNNHLANIEKVVLLRFLSIRRTNVSELPANIGEIQHLETLDVRETKVRELPSTIVQLQRLVRLFVNKDVTFPEKGVGNMQSLEELSSVYAWQQPESFLKDLGDLTKLRVLGVQWFDKFFGENNPHWDVFVSSLCALGRHNLHSLYFTVHEIPHCFTDDSWFHALRNLRKLCIDGRGICYIPSWTGSLVNLEHLELHTEKITQEDLQALGALPALEALVLGYTRTKDRLVVSSSDGFRHLKFFRVEVLNVLFMPCSVPNLKELRISLDVLRDGWSDSGIQHLTRLTKLHAHITGSRSYKSSVDILQAKIRSVVDAHPNRPTLTIETFITKRNWF